MLQAVGALITAAVNVALTVGSIVVGLITLYCIVDDTIQMVRKMGKR